MTFDPAMQRPSPQDAVLRRSVAELVIPFLDRVSTLQIEAAFVAGRSRALKRDVAMAARQRAVALLDEVDALQGEVQAAFANKPRDVAAHPAARDLGRSLTALEGLLAEIVNTNNK